MLYIFRGGGVGVDFRVWGAPLSAPPVDGGGEVFWCWVRGEASHLFWGVEPPARSVEAGRIDIMCSYAW